MSCKGGCVGGVGSLMNSKVLAKLLNNFSKKSIINYSLNNTKAKDVIDRLGSETFHRV